MKSIVTKIKKFAASYRWYVVMILIALFVSVWYSGVIFSTDETTDSSFFAIDEVEIGTVSSGISATGEIVAEQKLDLNVYKQQSRIDVLNVGNGSHVVAGDILFSFDKSDAYVAAAAANVSVKEASLNLENVALNSTDPNTQIVSLESQIVGYEKSMADLKEDKEDAWRDFLNDNIDIEPSRDRYSFQSSKTYPTIGGSYVEDVIGEYVIRIYRSGADSGYSFAYSGLESGVGSVYVGKSVDLGGRGLSITFPDDIEGGDVWIVKVPDETEASYAESYRTYQSLVADLDEKIRTTSVSLNNAKVELADLKATDGSDYRDLDAEKAKSQLAEAQQRLIEQYDALEERDVVAPFSGTIQDMENMVVGATPTGGESDTIKLGTLISDTYLVTFTLSAADVAKINVGQKVNLSVTSYQDSPAFTASITEISSLPASSGVAQYEVRAKIDYVPSESPVALREGMLADIEIVQEEKENILRIPASAVTYVQGRPTVTVVDSLTNEQQEQYEQMGIVRTTSEEVMATYTKNIEVGIQGLYYVEVVSGLEEGDLLLTASVTEAAAEAVVSQGFGGPPGGGQRRSSEEASEGSPSD